VAPNNSALPVRIRQSRGPIPNLTPQARSVFKKPQPLFKPANTFSFFGSHIDLFTKMAQYDEEKIVPGAPRPPIAIMASTAKPPDPMPCALAAVLLPESRAHGCHIVPETGFSD